MVLNHEQISLYAATLPIPELPAETPTLSPQERERAAWYWLTLNAINFGSGWFPTLNKRPGRSGYATVSAGITKRFDRFGPWSAKDLTQVTPAEIARTLGQRSDHELMALFAASLNDLGARIGDPLELIGDSAVALVETLQRWPCFADSSTYANTSVPFLKRAQIAAADLHRAGVARFDDLDQLTMFADNLVPHVLRLDGILSFSPALVRRIDAEQLIEHGSTEEIEIRACALHAVELIVAAFPHPVAAAQVDELLWHRGQGATYKAKPRHRSRCTAY